MCQIALGAPAGFSVVNPAQHLRKFQKFAEFTFPECHFPSSLPAILQPYLSTEYLQPYRSMSSLLSSSDERVTRIACKYAERCWFGVHCTFGHTETEVRHFEDLTVKSGHEWPMSPFAPRSGTVKPREESYKFFTKMCKYGFGCGHGLACTYLHPPNERRFFQTRSSDRSLVDGHQQEAPSTAYAAAARTQHEADDLDVSMTSSDRDDSGFDSDQISIYSEAATSDCDPAAATIDDATSIFDEAASNHDDIATNDVAVQIQSEDLPSDRTEDRSGSLIATVAAVDPAAVPLEQAPAMSYILSELKDQQEQPLLQEYTVVAPWCVEQHRTEPTLSVLPRAPRLWSILSSNRDLSLWW